MQALTKDMILIWKELSRDANQPLKLIAKNLNLPYSKVRRVVETLVHEGYIQGYQAILNPFALGVKFTLITFFKTNTCEPEFLNALRRHPGVEHVYRISGGYSLAAIINYQDRVDYENGVSALDVLVSRSRFKKSEMISVIKILKKSWFIFPPSLIEQSYKVDEVDKNIIEVIKYQPVSTEHYLPYSTSYLSELIGKSQPSIHRRLQRLREQKVILTTTTYPHPNQFAKDSYLLSIKVDLSEYEPVREFLLKDNRVRDLYRVGRDYQFRAIVTVESVQSLRKFIDELYKYSAVLDTETRIVFSEEYNRYIEGKLFDKSAKQFTAEELADFVCGGYNPNLETTLQSQ